jgi:hypothetical protein
MYLLLRTGDSKVETTMRDEMGAVDKWRFFKKYNMMMMIQIRCQQPKIQCLHRDSDIIY